jgi:hypothetical protein
MMAQIQDRASTAAPIAERTNRMGKQRKIVDAKAKPNGNISHIRFEGNSRYTSVERAIPIAERGEIANTHVVRRSGAKPHLRTNADGRNRNNLDYMAGDS